MPLLPSHTLLQAYALTLIGSSYLLLSRPLSLLNASPLWLLGESMHIRRASFVPASPNIGQNPSTSAPGGVTLQGKRSLVESVLGSGVLLDNSVREVLALLAVVLFVAAVTQGILASPLRYSKTGLIALAVKSGSRGAPAFGGGGNRDDGGGDRNAVSEFAEKVHTLHTAQTLFLTVSGLRVVLEGSLVAAIYVLYSGRVKGLGQRLDEGLAGVGGADVGVMGLLANRIVFAVAMGDMLFWGYLYTVIREEARDVAEVLARRMKLVEESVM